MGDFFCCFLSFSSYYYHVFCSHREVWNVQYRILQSMQAKNCGTLFSVYGICKCTGRNYLYFSNVISLIWGKTVLQLPESQTMQMRIWLLISFSYYMSGAFVPDISGPQIWLSVGRGIQIDHFWPFISLLDLHKKSNAMSVEDLKMIWLQWPHTKDFMFFVN